MARGEGGGLQASRDLMPAADRAYFYVPSAATSSPRLIFSSLIREPGVVASPLLRRTCISLLVPDLARLARASCTILASTLPVLASYLGRVGTFFKKKTAPGSIAVVSARGTGRGTL